MIVTALVATVSIPVAVPIAINRMRNLVVSVSVAIQSLIDRAAICVSIAVAVAIAIRRLRAVVVAEHPSSRMVDAEADEESILSKHLVRPKPSAYYRIGIFTARQSLPLVTQVERIVESTELHVGLLD